MSTDATDPGDDEAPKPRCFLCGGPVTVTDGSTGYTSESEDYAHDSCQEDLGEDDPIVLENMTLSQLDDAIALGRELAQLRSKVDELTKERDEIAGRLIWYQDTNAVLVSENSRIYGLTKERDALETLCAEEQERLAELREEVRGQEEKIEQLETEASTAHTTARAHRTSLQEVFDILVVLETFQPKAQQLAIDQLGEVIAALPTGGFPQSKGGQ